MDVSHEISNLTMVWKQGVLIFLEFCEQYSKLANHHAHKNELEENVNIDCERVLNISSPGSEHLIQYKKSVH